jgi:hypothetical protein
MASTQAACPKSAKIAAANSREPTAAVRDGIGFVGRTGFATGAAGFRRVL